MDSDKTLLSGDGDELLVVVALEPKHKQTYLKFHFKNIFFKTPNQKIYLLLRLGAVCSLSDLLLTSALNRLFVLTSLRVGVAPVDEDV